MRRLKIFLENLDAWMRLVLLLLFVLALFLASIPVIISRKLHKQSWWRRYAWYPVRAASAKTHKASWVWGRTVWVTTIRDEFFGIWGFVYNVDSPYSSPTVKHNTRHMRIRP